MEVVLEGKVPVTSSVEQAVLAATKRLLATPQAPAPLPGITGLLLFYSPAYQYETGFVYNQGQPLAERVRFLRSPKSTVTAPLLTDGTSTQEAIDDENETGCIMELRCGYANGDMSNCIYVPHCYGSPPGDGGGGGWGGGGGGGGSTPTPPPVPIPTTPCGALTRDGQNIQVKAKFNELKALLTDNKEYGVGTYYDAAGNPIFANVVGQPGVLGIDINTITGTFSSFTHTHFSDSNSLSIFSPYDLQAMGVLYDGGNMENTSTFNMNIITASGTAYSLSISNVNAFATFYNNTLKDKVNFDNFERLYGTLYHIDPTNTIAQNEKAFLQMLTQANIGLTLYKGDQNNFASWQKISYDNSTNTPSSSPCN